MKLTKKIMLFEDFATNAASDNTSATPVAPTTNTSVSLDATTTHDVSGETLRTEVLKDVDSILTRLSELSDNIKEGLDIHTGFNEYESLLEELVEHPSFHNIDEGLGDMLTNIKAFASNPIKFTKLKNNLKKYQKALVQQSINNVDFAKKKQASNDDGKDKKRAETLDAANKAKNQALKDTVDAIEARMKDLATSEPLKLYSNLKKNSAKIQAAQIVLKAASGEEAKQLKLKIETLEDRISDDGKSLKDYAAQDGENGAQAQDTSIDGGAKGEGAKGEGAKGEGAKGEGAKGGKDDKKAQEIEKAKEAVTKAQEAIDALPKGPDGQPTSDPKKAEAELAKLTAELKVAELEENTEKIAEIKEKIANAKKAAALKPYKSTGGAAVGKSGGDSDLTDEERKAKNSKEGKIKRYKDLLAKEDDEAKKQIYQQKINDLQEESWEAFLDSDYVAVLEAELLEFENLEENLETIQEAVLGDLMAYDAEEDGYKYLKAQAKKLGVKVAVASGDKSIYWDMGYDSLTYTGKKDAVLKLAAISGHDQDICDGEEDCGGYILKESDIKLTLPKKVKLYEGMSVADKFKALM